MPQRSRDPKNGQYLYEDLNKKKLESSLPTFSAMLPLPQLCLYVSVSYYIALLRQNISSVHCLYCLSTLTYGINIGRLWDVESPSEKKRAVIIKQKDKKGEDKQFVEVRKTVYFEPGVNCYVLQFSRKRVHMCVMKC